MINDLIKSNMTNNNRVNKIYKYIMKPFKIELPTGKNLLNMILNGGFGK